MANISVECIKNGDTIGYCGVFKDINVDRLETDSLLFLRVNIAFLKAYSSILMLL